MNMISTGAFLNEMDASNKQPTVAEKFAAVWEKKNAKAARAGGVSLMALSLAACGSSSSTTTTTSSTESTTTTTVTPVSTALTLGVDNASGTSGDDSFSAAQTASSLDTWNSTDTIAGGAGTDTLTATISGDITPASGAITGVENITVTNVSTNADTGAAVEFITFSTATATYISGVTHITDLASIDHTTFSRVTELAELTVNNTNAATTLQFADAVMAGTADTATVNLIGASGVVTVGTVSDADGGYETLVVNASGAASDMGTGQGLGATASTITVNATAAVDFGSNANFPKFATFDASGSTAGVTLVLGADGVTGSTNTKSVTMGAGADTLDLGLLDDGEIGALTIAMGAGNDTLDVDDFAATDLTATGGDGTDTLQTKAAISAANAAGISGFETLKSDGADTTHDLSAYANNTFTAGYANGADTEFTNAAAAFNTLYMNAAGTTTAKVDYLVDGTVAGGNANSTSVVMKANARFSGDLNVAETEYLTIDSSDGSISVGDDGNANATSGDGGVIATDLVTLTLVGDNDIDLVGESVSGTANTLEGATLITTIDATGVTGTAAVTVSATASTKAMTVTGPASTGTFTVTTGAAADTITAGAGILVATGGDGDDTINGGAKGDTITGGEGNDAIYLGDGDAKADTVKLAGTALGGTDTIYHFNVGSTGTDVIDMLTNSGMGHAAITGYEEFSNAAAWATNVDANASDLNDVAMAVIGTNLNTAGGITTADLVEIIGGAAVLGKASNTTNLDADFAGYVAADDGTDTYIFRYVNTSGGSADNTITATDTLSIVAVIDGLADATTLVAGNFSDYS